MGEAKDFCEFWKTFSMGENGTEVAYENGTDSVVSENEGAMNGHANGESNGHSKSHSSSSKHKHKDKERERRKETEEERKIRKQKEKEKLKHETEEQRKELHVMGRTLASPVSDHGSRALHHLPCLPVLVYLAQTRPLSQLHVRVHLYKRDPAH